MVALRAPAHTCLGCHSAAGPFGQARGILKARCHGCLRDERANRRAADAARAPAPLALVPSDPQFTSPEDFARWCIEDEKSLAMDLYDLSNPYRLGLADRGVE